MMSPQTAHVAQTVDALFDGFVAKLPRKLKAPARDLPRRLGLTSVKNTPWSAVFSNPAVLGLPSLVLANGRCPCSPATLHAAARAHLMATIGAIGITRIDAGQVSVTSVTAELVSQVQRLRNAALNHLDQGDAPVTWNWAQRQVWGASLGERTVFRGNEPATWESYRAIALMKQGLALPAILAAAKAEGWSSEVQQLAGEAIRGVMLGLQYRNDVLNWCEDHVRKASWAVALLPPETAEIPVERRLAAHGVLVKMLELSRDAFERANVAAAALEAGHLAHWTAQQASLTGGLARMEAHCPGAAVSWSQKRRAYSERQQSVLAAVA